MNTVIFYGSRNKIFKWNEIDLILYDKNQPDKIFELVDYVIENDDQLSINQLKQLMIETLLINSDRNYILIYPNSLKVIPFNKNLEQLGIIDMNSSSISKKYQYNFQNNKCVSFCLYGNIPKYTIGAIKNLEQYKNQYTCVFYVRRDVPIGIIDQLKQNGGHIIYTSYIPDWLMKMTRFYLVENDSLELYLSRDTDSRYSTREELLINNWVNSDKIYHIIRDHPLHFALILAGLWGSKKTISTIRLMMFEWCNEYLKIENKDKTGLEPDQLFLAKKMYSKIKKQSMCHDTCFRTNYNSWLPPRIDGEYLGESFDQNDHFDQSLRVNK